MKPQFINLGDRLRSLRRNSQKSQHALADECWALGLPITRDMIASWEISRAEIPAQLIPFIAYTLNAQVADLLPDLRVSAFAGCKGFPRRLATRLRTPKPREMSPGVGSGALLGSVFRLRSAQMIAFASE